MITQKEIKELIDYDPETGEAFWKERNDSHIKNPSSLKTWNTRFAGKIINSINCNGYYRARVEKKSYLLHRLIWLYIYGEWPNVIDHINGIIIDNRICNLRNTTIQGNALNQKRNSKNTSGVTGVYWNKRDCSWYAQIKFNKKAHRIGSDKSFFEAVCMRKSEENKLGFSIRHSEA